MTRINKRAYFIKCKIIDNTLWFVDWDLRYLCALNLESGKVIKKSLIPTGSSLALQSYIHIDSYKDRLAIFPFNELQSSMMIYDIASEEFIQCKMKTSKEENIRFLSSYDVDGVIYSFGYSLSHKYSPVICKLDVEGGSLNTINELNKVIQCDANGGINFGRTNAESDGCVYVPQIEDNWAITVNVGNGELKRVENTKIDRILAIDKLDKELFLADHKGLLRGTTFAKLERVMENSEFETFNTDMIRYGDNLITSVENLPEIKCVNLNNGEIKSVQFKITKECRRDYPPIVVPIGIWKDYCIVFSFADGRIHFLNNALEVVRSIDVLIDAMIGYNDLKGMQLREDGLTINSFIQGLIL